MSDSDSEYKGLGCVWPLIVLAIVVPICVAAVQIAHIMKDCR